MNDLIASIEEPCVDGAGQVSLREKTRTNNSEHQVYD
jgi:hypothetical protein